MKQVRMQIDPHAGPAIEARGFVFLLNMIQPGEETAAVRSVLNAAGWTYVAAFITSLVYFIWHLLPLVLGRNDD